MVFQRRDDMWRQKSWATDQRKSVARKALVKQQRPENGQLVLWPSRTYMLSFMCLQLVLAFEISNIEKTNSFQLKVLWSVVVHSSLWTLWVLCLCFKRGIRFIAGIWRFGSRLRQSEKSDRWVNFIWSQYFIHWYSYFIDVTNQKSYSTFVLMCPSSISVSWWISTGIFMLKIQRCSMKSKYVI